MSVSGSAGFEPSASLDHVGIVERVGDGVATVKGLPWTRLDELVRFEDGTMGLALTVDIFSRKP